MTQVDALSSGRERPRRRLLPVLVGVGLLAGVGADRWQGSREAADLVRCVERGEAAASHAGARVRGTVQYASPQLTAAGTDPRVRTSLEQLVQGSAAAAEAALISARAACTDVRAVPWRAPVGEARDAYVALLDRQRERFAAIATDLDVLYAEDVVLPRLRAGAVAAMTQALSGGREARSVELLSP